MNTGNDYKQGQEAIFFENGEVYRVIVLETNGNKKWERYRLRILNVMGKNPEFPPNNIGDEIECEKIRNTHREGLWNLLD